MAEDYVQEFEPLVCDLCGCGWSTFSKKVGGKCLDYGTCQGTIRRPTEEELEAESRKAALRYLESGNCPPHHQITILQDLICAERERQGIEDPE